MRTLLAFTPLILAGAAFAQQDPQTKQPRPPVIVPDIKGMNSTPEPYVKPSEPMGPVRPATGNAQPKDGKAGGVRAAITAAEATFNNPDLVMVDHPGDGRTWVHGFSYKASFGADGVVFAPLFQNAPKHFPLHLNAPQVTVAGHALRNGGTSVADADHLVTFDRGDFQERYQLQGQAIEQQFVFDRLAQRGTIVVTVPFTTTLTGQRNGDGIVFGNEFGKVDYTQAVAVDARGQRLALTTELHGNTIEITVPASFVENAQMPLVIDPLVGSSVHITPGTFAPPVIERNPDIAYDVTNDEYAVVYHRFLNAQDTDVYVQRMSGAFALIGGPVNIDFTFDVWEHCKIANNNIADNNLVVAQVSTDGTSPFWISGRTIAAGTGAVGSQFIIEQAGLPSHASGDKINPDVGGDPATVPATYYMVVWERVFSATDHDIHGKQVLANSTLRTAAPILIENSSGTIDTHPGISKSDGWAPFTNQSWAIGFQRTFSATDEDIRGCLISWDGIILQVAAANTFSVDFTGNKDLLPIPSSPTDVAGGSRYVLFTYESQPNGGGQGDIHGTVFDVTGTRRSAEGVNLTQLDGATAAQLAFPQSRPTCDSDGCRFIVAFDEWYNAGGVDQDVLISLYSFQAAAGTGGSLVLNESRQTAGYTTGVETHASVTSVHSGGGGMTRYAGAWSDDNLTGNDLITGIRYDGYRSASTIGSRATGCGTLTLAATNNRLGDTMVLTLTGATGFAGFLFGAPQPGVPIGPCPSCQLGVAGGTTLTGNPFNIYLPCQLGALVGATFAVEGFDFSSGPCLGQLKISNTLDIAIQ